MHCGSLERNGTPRKRTLSRGMSEDESLRHIIKEAEETTKRLTRSDSRYGSLKRGEGGLSQSEEDSLAGIPDMVELQANYDSVLLELRDLEVQRETLLFQVDCLQDALEGAEEMLAEAHREAHDTSMELDREREARRKLEDMVSSLMQEVERLKEERNSIPAVPVYTLVRDGTRETTTEETQDAQTSSPPPHNKSQAEAPFTLVRLDSTPVSQTPPATHTEGQADGSNGGLLSFLKKGKGEQPQDSRTTPAWLQNAPMGTSVDQEPEQVRSQEGSPSEGPLAKLSRMVKGIGQSPSLELSERPTQEGVFRGNQGVGKQTADDADDNDESSGYEDAQSELQENLPGASTPDMSPDAGFLDGEEAADEVGEEAEEGSMKTGETGSPKPNDSCVLS